MTTGGDFIPRNIAQRPQTVVAAQPTMPIIGSRMNATTLKRCIRLVADATRLTPEYLRLPTRRRAIARPRQIAMWLARKATNRAYADIAAYLGLSDHSTAIHAFQNIERLRARDPEILDLTDRLLDRVTA